MKVNLKLASDSSSRFIYSWIIYLGLIIAEPLVDENDGQRVEIEVTYDIPETEELVDDPEAFVH